MTYIRLVFSPIKLVSSSSLSIGKFVITKLNLTVILKKSLVSRNLNSNVASALGCPFAMLHTLKFGFETKSANGAEPFFRVIR